MTRLDPPTGGGNIGMIISFRIGTDDARLMATEVRQLADEFDVEDFLRLRNYHIYLKLMIDGKPSSPFSGITYEYETNNLIIQPKV